MLNALKSRRFWIIFAAALLVLAVGGGIWLHFWLFKDLPDLDNLTLQLHTPSIRITDRRGRLLYEIIGEEEGRHNVVPLEMVPAACIQATVATEDANFYTNPGVDARAIIRAVWINLRGGEVISGGSTITQQVARNLLLGSQERTLRRKLRESILAYRLARRYEKDDILALYLNQSNYGNLSYGIDAAARGYFSKGVNELDLAECALIAGLPQAPSLYDPLTDPEAAQARQETVLRLMTENNFITPEQAEAARNESLAFASERYPIKAPHFVLAVNAQLEELLPPETYLAGGLEVRTTLDLDWQEAAQRIAQRQLDELNHDDLPRNAHNAALVALDPHTGQVLAMLGSPDFFDPAISGAINLAIAPRQPGSTIKPFTYAATFDPTRPEPWTPATMILDVRTTFQTHDGFPYTPVNYDRREHGPVLVREALASSYNVPAVVALDMVGIDELMLLTSQLGITTFNDADEYDLSVTLGGGELPLMELTTAYAAFATGGRAVQPMLILDVTNADGEVILKPEGGPGQQVIDPRVSWLITDILSDNLARAPSFTTHSVLQIGRPAAVKTGTTTDYRDNWTVGYTPNLVVGVWVGNANHDPMVGISGVSGAGPIWHQFMRTVLRGQPELEFEQPPGLVEFEICSLSGLLPSPDCPYTRREWFIAGTQPIETDTVYRKLLIDAATGLPAAADTPPERLREEIFLDLPPQAHAWARSEGLLLLPDILAAEAAQESGEQVLAITYPDANTIFRISPSLPLDSQRLQLIAIGPQGTHDVTFYLDDVPIMTIGSPPFEAWWNLQIGTHSLYVTGMTAAGEQITSPVVAFVVNPPE